VGSKRWSGNACKCAVWKHVDVECSTRAVGLSLHWFEHPMKYHHYTNNQGSE
jgi:hypothetical protein